MESGPAGQSTDVPWLWAVVARGATVMTNKNPARSPLSGLAVVSAERNESWSVPGGRDDGISHRDGLLSTTPALREFGLRAGASPSHRRVRTWEILLSKSFRAIFRQESFFL